MAIGALDVACLDPSGGDFKHVVEPLVEGAMRLLESTKSRDVLTKYGATLLDLQEAKPSKQMKYNHKAADSDKVSTYLQVFLDKVRSSFPKIYLERMAADGVASRRDWGGELMDYDPKLAGHITLDYVTLANMVNAEEERLTGRKDVASYRAKAKEEEARAQELWDDYHDLKRSRSPDTEKKRRRHASESHRPSRDRDTAAEAEAKTGARAAEQRAKDWSDKVSASRGKAANAYRNHKAFQFQMTLTIAHELVHFFTCYITGGPTAEKTPPPVHSSHYYHGPDRGEAGGYWENEMFGGAIFFYEDTQDPLMARQAGIPYLGSGEFKKATYWRVSFSYMEALVDPTKVLSFPALTEGNKEKAKSLPRPMNDVRSTAVNTPQPLLSGGAHQDAPAPAFSYQTPNLVSSSSGFGYRSPAIANTYTGASYSEYTQPWNYPAGADQGPSGSVVGYEDSGASQVLRW